MGIRIEIHQLNPPKSQHNSPIQKALIELSGLSSFNWSCVDPIELSNPKNASAYPTYPLTQEAMDYFWVRPRSSEVKFDVRLAATKNMTVDNQPVIVVICSYTYSLLETCCEDLVYGIFKSDRLVDFILCCSDGISVLLE
jgi:hypothetical protein